MNTKTTLLTTFAMMVGLTVALPGGMAASVDTNPTETYEAPPAVQDHCHEHDDWIPATVCEVGHIVGDLTIRWASDHCHEHDDWIPATVCEVGHIVGDITVDNVRLN